MRFLLVLAALGGFFSTALSAQSSVETQPNSAEALQIYVINRARANPQAYDTENSLGGILTGITPAPSLAYNPRLVTSARFHSSEMAQNGYFAHQSAVTGQWPNQMVRNAGYPLKSSFSNGANNVESLACRFSSSSGGVSYGAEESVEDLIVDTGVSPPGHRYHLLAWGGNASEINFYRQFVEIGCGYATGFRPESPYSSATPPDGSGAYWSIHTGVRDATQYFICGVVYLDTNLNGRYDAGEGLGGVTVNANGGLVNVPATTNSEGLYWLQLNSATWTLTASGGTFGGPTYAQVTLGSANIAVDFRATNSTVDINFGTWGALPGSTTQNGSSNPGMGTGGIGGTGSGGGSGGNPPGAGGSSSDDSGGGGCSTNEDSSWFALLLAAMGACVLAANLRRGAIA